MSTKKYINSPEADTTPIRPEHINVNEHFWNAFDHSETEVSARWLVRFCQMRKEGWVPISLDKLQSFYEQLRKNPGERFLFNHLVRHDGGEGQVMVVGGLVILSIQFIGKCYASSPAC